MVLSYTFRELGQEALGNGLGWITCAVLRSSCIHAVRGGWSCLLRLFLEGQLFGRAGLATVGCPLSVKGNHFLLFAKLTNVLSDGDGLRQAYDWRGASGLKGCVKHYNVWKKASFVSSQIDNLQICVSVQANRLRHSLHAQLCGVQPYRQAHGRGSQLGHLHASRKCDAFLFYIRAVIWHTARTATSR